MWCRLLLPCPTSHIEIKWPAEKKTREKDAAFKVSMVPCVRFSFPHIFCFDLCINLAHFSRQSNSFTRSLELIVTLHHHHKIYTLVAPFTLQFIFAYFNCVPIVSTFTIIYPVMHAVEFTTAVCPLNGTWCNGARLYYFETVFCHGRR